MNKINLKIWGRSFSLPYMIKQYSNGVILETQTECFDELKENPDFFSSSKKAVEKYIIDKYGKENNLETIDNIFKYVVPKSVYISQSKKKEMALLCHFKFDVEHGMAIVFEDGKLKTIGQEGIAL